uniref:Uncharacterized protein n=1 Tax=Amphiprion percula TaxID=161767 RepID=A0A3P8TIR9_AMPPE
MFWNCQSLNSFWKNISEVLSYMCRKLIASPFISIFGVPPPEITVPAPQAKAIAFASLMACRLILLQWKSDKPPSFDSWIREMLSMLQLEKLRYSRANCLENFRVTWSLFFEYVQNLYEKKLQNCDFQPEGHLQQTFRCHTDVWLVPWKNQTETLLLLCKPHTCN